MRFKFLFTLENEKFPIQYRKSIMSFIKMSLQEYNEETFDNQVYTLEEIKDILKIGRNSSYNQWLPLHALQSLPSSQLPLPDIYP